MQAVDCLIVGGGPAGLTAGIYLARFHLSVKIIDAGNSRAGLIPRTMNHAGFPEGIAGAELLQRMRLQAQHYNVGIELGTVRALKREADGFIAETNIGDIAARAILIATGVTNKRPAIEEELHAQAVQAGRLRYCPVCDGYEVTGQKVGVIGTGARAMREAEFLRSYTSWVSVISAEESDGLDDRSRTHLSDIGVNLIAGPAHDFRLETGGISVAGANGRLVFDTIYPALGSIVHSDLAVGLGAAVTEERCIKTDAHQRTSVAGLYAAGDVVIGLDQISHAMGEAGVAATTIRNDLAAKGPLLWRTP